MRRAVEPEQTRHTSRLEGNISHAMQDGVSHVHARVPSEPPKQMACVVVVVVDAVVVAVVVDSKQMRPREEDPTPIDPLGHDV